ncbi:MAG: hypothetical protein ACT4O1_16120 [Gemmatimonadota bacterium]
MAAVRHWPSDIAMAESRRIVTTLCECPTVHAVVVFGSAVRCDVKSFDLDLLYVYDGQKPTDLRPRMEIDLRGYSRSKVEGLVSAGHDLLCWSLKFGKVVCERNNYWTDLQAHWLPVLPFPSDAEAQNRAAKAWELFSDLLDAKDFEAALEQYVTYLTHIARAALICAGVYPASRPELPNQLRSIKQLALATQLENALRRRQLLSEGRDERVMQLLLAAQRSGTRAKSA